MYFLSYFFIVGIEREAEREEPIKTIKSPALARLSILACFAL